MSELNKSRISYAITGATATSYYGVPRTTADVDFVVKVSSKSLSRFTRTLENAGLKADREKIKRQLKTEYDVVTVPDSSSPYRAVFVIQQETIERRKGSLLGISTYYQSPETLILAKLSMIKVTVGMEKRFNDRSDIQAILANTRVDTPDRAGSKKTDNLGNLRSDKDA